MDWLIIPNGNIRGCRIKMQNKNGWMATSSTKLLSQFQTMNTPSEYGLMSNHK